jgi:2,3-bisphosphoglycerate-dependent phosphoglycerate mutase
MSKLVLVRHGKSEWNKLGLWTGLTDVSLTDEGREEAKRAGRSIAEQKIDIDKAYTSSLKRTKETLAEIESVLGKKISAKEESPAINERDYGVYTGKNKWQIKEEVGEEEFKRIRRGWDTFIPNGESLKDVFERVMPFYNKSVLPDLKAGKNVLLVGSGNSLRALVKGLEKISDADIGNLEFGTGEVYVYEIDNEGNILHKNILVDNLEKLRV